MEETSKSNFGRVIYLTLIRRMTNAKITKGLAESMLDNSDNITICFDPAKDVNLNTRIDFYVKRMGDSGIGNNGAYQVANIDVWNIGPALQQFLDAYNAYGSEGHFQGVNTKKYAAVLQIGYRNEPQKNTIFVGHISSFVLERQQNNSTVDNVWHFFCQYPDPQQNGEVGQSKAQSGTDYAQEYYANPQKYWTPTQTFMSWEGYLKSAIMATKREIYTLEPIEEFLNISSFDEQNMTPFQKAETPLMCVKPRWAAINASNFSKNFEIKYQFSKTSPELTNVKQYWQQRVPVRGWRLDTSSLARTVSGIAKVLNCHARIELEENTGKQIIYIYPPQSIVKPKKKVKTDFTIVDYQNLRTPPQVSANMLHLDMILEPGMQPGSTIELQITKDFQKKHPHPTFEPNFSMANTTTVFAGANFIGLAEMNQAGNKKNAIASAGNIFNTQFIVTLVELRGSSHTAEWSTKVDCYGVIVNGREVSA